LLRYDVLELIDNFQLSDTMVCNEAEPIYRVFLRLSTTDHSIWMRPPDILTEECQWVEAVLVVKRGVFVGLVQVAVESSFDELLLGNQWRRVQRTAIWRMQYLARLGLTKAYT